MGRSSDSPMVFPVLFVLVAVLVEGGLAEFECPEPSGIFPDPDQCDKYWVCSRGEASRKLCPDGLAYHTSKPEGEDPCDMIHNVPDKCKGRDSFQRPKPGDSHCPRQNGVYPSEVPGECDTFYSCLEGVSSSTKCAEGLHYSVEVGTCVWARDSGRTDCQAEAPETKRKRKKEPAAAAAASKTPDAAADDNQPAALDNGFKCPGGKLGVHPALPHPTSCRAYYVCLNGVTPNEAGCSSGLVFNPSTSACDNPANVPGCEDTYAKKFLVKNKSSSSTREEVRSSSSSSSSSVKPDLSSAEFSGFLALLKENGLLKEGALKALNEAMDESGQGGKLSRENDGRRSMKVNERKISVKNFGREQDDSAEEEEDESEPVRSSNRLQTLFAQRGQGRRNRFNKFLPRLRSQNRNEANDKDADDEEEKEVEEGEEEEEEEEELVIDEEMEKVMVNMLKETKDETMKMIVKAILNDENDEDDDKDSTTTTTRSSGLSGLLGRRRRPFFSTRKPGALFTKPRTRFRGGTLESVGTTPETSSTTSSSLDTSGEEDSEVDSEEDNTIETSAETEKPVVTVKDRFRGLFNRQRTRRPFRPRVKEMHKEEEDEEIAEMVKALEGEEGLKKEFEMFVKKNLERRPSTRFRPKVSRDRLRSSFRNRFRTTTTLKDLVDEFEPEEDLETTTAADVTEKEGEDDILTTEPIAVTKITEITTTTTEEVTNPVITSTLPSTTTSTTVQTTKTEATEPSTVASTTAVQSTKIFLPTANTEAFEAITTTEEAEVETVPATSSRPSSSDTTSDDNVPRELFETTFANLPSEITTLPPTTNSKFVPTAPDQFQTVAPTGNGNIVNDPDYEPFEYVYYEYYYDYEYDDDEEKDFVGGNDGDQEAPRSDGVGVTSPPLFTRPAPVTEGRQPVLDTTNLEQDSGNTFRPNLQPQPIFTSFNSGPDPRTVPASIPLPSFVQETENPPVLETTTFPARRPEPLPGFQQVQEVVVTQQPFTAFQSEPAILRQPNFPPTGSRDDRPLPGRFEPTGFRTEPPPPPSLLEYEEYDYYEDPVPTVPARRPTAPSLGQGSVRGPTGGRGTTGLGAVRGQTPAPPVPLVPDNLLSDSNIKFPHFQNFKPIDVNEVPILPPAPRRPNPPPFAPAITFSDERIQPLQSPSGLQVQLEEERRVEQERERELARQREVELQEKIRLEKERELEIKRQRELERQNEVERNLKLEREREEKRRQEEEKQRALQKQEEEKRQRERERQEELARERDAKRKEEIEKEEQKKLQEEEEKQKSKSKEENTTFGPFSAFRNFPQFPRDKEAVDFDFLEGNRATAAPVNPTIAPRQEITTTQSLPPPPPPPPSPSPASSLPEVPRRLPQSPPPLNSIPPPRPPLPPPQAQQEEFEPSQPTQNRPPPPSRPVTPTPAAPPPPPPQPSGFENPFRNFQNQLGQPPQNSPPSPAQAPESPFRNQQPFTFFGNQFQQFAPQNQQPASASTNIRFPGQQQQQQQQPQPQQRPPQQFQTFSNRPQQQPTFNNNNQFFNFQQQQTRPEEPRSISSVFGNGGSSSSFQQFPNTFFNPGPRFSDRPSPSGLPAERPSPPRTVFSLQNPLQTRSGAQQPGSQSFGGFPQPTFGGFRPVKRHLTVDSLQERTGEEEEEEQGWNYRQGPRERRANRNNNSRRGPTSHKSPPTTSRSLATKKFSAAAATAHKQQLADTAAARLGASGRLQQEVTRVAYYEDQNLDDYNNAIPDSDYYYYYYE